MKRRKFVKSAAALVAVPSLSLGQSLTCVSTPIPPTISNATATPASLPVGGGSVIIAANVAGATSYQINGASVASLPSIINVLTSGNQILTVTGPGGCASWSFPITVATVAPPPPLALVPAVGAARSILQYNMGPADWIDPAKVAVPITWVVWSDAANKMLAPPQNGVRPAAWKKIHLCGNPNMLHERTPRIVAGRHLQTYPGSEMSPLMTILPGFAMTHTQGGPRGTSFMSPYTNWHGHRVHFDAGELTQPSNDATGVPDAVGVPFTNPRMPLYMGVRMQDGMLIHLMRNGDTRDLRTVPGNKAPYDFTFFLPDNRIFFVADTLNGRIVKVDRHAAVAAQVKPSPEDVALWAFSDYAVGFAKPTGIRCVDDGTMYVCDQTAGTLTKIDTSGARAVVLNLPGVFAVDYLSDGRLVLITDVTGVYIFNPASGALSAQLMPPAYYPQQFSDGFFSTSADRKGTVGPVDEFYVTRNIGPNTMVWRFESGGAGVTFIDKIFKQIGSASIGNTDHCGSPIGTYAWNLSVHPDEAIILEQSVSNAYPNIFRPQLATDVAEDVYDHYLFVKGQAIIRAGTVAGSVGTKPSFTALMNASGWSLLAGCSCDAIAELSFAEQAAFVQKGMIGSFPRPELVGHDLLALLYFINRSSQRFLREGVTLMNGLRAYIGPVTATPSPVVPFTTADIFAEAFADAAGIGVSFVGTDWPTTAEATITIRVLVDEGMPSQIDLGTQPSPWRFPKPMVSAGPHALTCKITGGTKSYHGHATVWEA